MIVAKPGQGVYHCVHPRIAPDMPDTGRTTFCGIPLKQVCDSVDGYVPTVLFESRSANHPRCPDCLESPDWALYLLSEV